MNWLKTLWNGLVQKTATAEIKPTSVEVEEETEECELVEIFLGILREAGISKHVKKVNGIELFVEWYEGACDEKSIRASIEDFKLAHPSVAAKMAGKL
jgi:hypothetical protein